MGNVTTTTFERAGSFTTGGLLKFSVALKPDLVQALDVLAEERDTSRSKVIALLARIGLEELERMRRMQQLAN